MFCFQTIKALKSESVLFTSQVHENTWLREIVKETFKLLSTVIESLPAASIKYTHATPQSITCSVKSIVKPIRNFVSMKMHIWLVKMWKRTNCLWVDTWCYFEGNWLATRKITVGCRLPCHISRGSKASLTTYWAALDCSSSCCGVT